MPEFAPGDVFAQHRIEGLAGRGGMGVVYRATELGLERTVALKIISPALAEEQDFRERFVAESKAAASIEHPNVVPIYHAGEHDGVLYIVMRYIDGPDLRALVRADGPLDPERAAHVVAQVAGALDAAHRRGLVHRDVKPANVLLGDGDHAYLTDFGLTKRSATSAGGLSRAGGWVGTLGYVAPEQIRGERVDARTDVYALGCVLVHALTGSAPYMRDTDEATLWAHLNAPPPSESVPPDFEGVVARALAKDPSDRYPSAGDLGRAALRAAGRSATAVPEGNVGRGPAAPVDAAAGATLRGPAVADPEGETRPSPRAAGPAPAGPPAPAPAPRRPPRRRVAIAAAAGVLLTGGVALALLADGGDDGGAGDDRATTTTPAGLRPAQVDITRSGINTRPNALTLAAGDVWALSNRTGEIVLVDAATGDDVDRIDVGRGGSSLAAGFHSVWVAKESTSTVLRYNAATRRRVPGGAVEVAVPGRNVAVATGARAVWVGVRNRSRSDRAPESVVRIDPSARTQQTITVAGGVQDIAVGAGAVWVSNRFSSTVTRIRVADGRQDRVRVGAGPRGIAVGEGAVWVASSLDDEITRINPRSLQTRSIPLEAIPERVAVGGGSVWVTAKEAGRLIRIDARTREIIETVDTGNRPYALDVSRGRAVWLTLLDEDGVRRVRFYRPAA